MVRRAGWVKDVCYQGAGQKKHLRPITIHITAAAGAEPAAVTMDDADAAASVPTFRRSSNNQRHIEVINQSINRLTSC